LTDTKTLNFLDVKCLRNIFRNNGYPDCFFNKAARKFQSDAITPLAMKNMKKIFFSRLVYLT